MNSGRYSPQTTNVIIIMPSFFRYELLFCLWFPYRPLVLLHVFVALIFVLYTLYVYIYIYQHLLHMNLSIFILLRGCACVIKTCLLRESRMLCFAYRGSWEELRGWRVMNPQLFDHYLKLCVFHISWF